MRNIAKIAAIGGVAVGAALAAKMMKQNRDARRNGSLPSSLDRSDRTEPRYDPADESA
jgi:hypothetical protein